MKLTNENYYSPEANKEYVSVSQYKDFCGTYGKRACEFEAMEKLAGRWNPPPSLPMMVGSYVDSYIEGTLASFKKEHPEVFTSTGELKAAYKKAEELIARIKRDKYFMKYLSGEKQTIMTADLFGVKWKIKMDSYIPGVAIVDLKVMASITENKWVKDIGYLDFVRYWGYDIRIIQVTQNYLDEALMLVESNIRRLIEVKSGEEEPDRCDACDCCRHNRILREPISILDLVSGI